LELILERLAAAGHEPDIYLDSQPVQQRSLESRRLATRGTLRGTIPERFNKLLAGMNANSASNGAYRRVRLRVLAKAAKQMADPASAHLFERPLLGSLRKRGSL
jgi:hypothetical protein